LVKKEDIHEEDWSYRCNEEFDNSKKIWWKSDSLKVEIVEKGILEIFFSFRLVNFKYNLILYKISI